eukprot:CAMPEP_0198469164 /NCGR_PEP_ID=MMETSP1456-20131121/11850_1 /TAXON_ID=1461544 ORGANISM="Unidentified sp., Strain RCC1871" /NCGR_SAMPLE_ID=MMETSP1456 /ASSEMBLY_ACC=CAM_ASM_001119 /LENGTH=144 /DNA_ID=CAMNT_0044195529 /DNA_START=368 /DNA_END=799 /DNA_ORIENTATION=-
MKSSCSEVSNEYASSFLTRLMHEGLDVSASGGSPKSALYEGITVHRDEAGMSSTRCRMHPFAISLASRSSSSAEGRSWAAGRSKGPVTDVTASAKPWHGPIVFVFVFVALAPVALRRRCLLCVLNFPSSITRKPSQSSALPPLV